MKLFIFLLFLLGLGNCNAPISEKITYPSDPKKQHLLAQVVSTTQENHFNPKVIDNAFSKTMFEAYLNLLDPEKIFFIKKDIEGLQSLGTKIDKELQEGTFIFFEKANQLFNQRLKEVEVFSKTLFDKNIDFKSKDIFETDPAKIDFANNTKDLKKRWKQKIKADILEEILLSRIDQTDPLFKAKIKEAIQRAKRLITLKLEQQRNISSTKRFHQYLYTFLKQQDYQTSFLSPEDRASWNAAYTRSLVGVGVSIDIIKGYPKIESLTIGGPAWKEQVLQKGDIILKIKNANQEAVETLGMSLSEIITLLKGDEGSAVELSIKRNDQEDFSTTIIRAAIRYDLVLSLLLEDSLSEKKVGYIRIPRFYIGDEGSAYHVYEAIKKLKANRVEGIIIDLRNNHGGSSGETISMLSYFLKAGVMMQTKSNDSEVRIIEDYDDDVSYDGELVVLVNDRSASGSELLSGTLQDYDRAVIVGGKATFGKGTMQRFFTFEDQDSSTEIGSSKMSIGIFYTAGGRSPQHTGIIPDIILPNNFTYVKSGERVQTTSLPPQNLDLQKCIQSVNTNPNLSSVVSRSKDRVKNNPRFQLADQKAKQIKEKQSLSSISLNLESRKKQQAKERALNDKFKNIFSNIEGYQVSLLPQDLKTKDSALIENNKIWQNNIQQDPYVYECFEVINDLYDL